LTVYDLRGAVVRRLWDGTAAAGGHKVAWDGTAEDGAPLPPGVYLYKLEAGGRAAARKLVLIR
jgi:flagellar hook assembly protein FlgD